MRRPIPYPLLAAVLILAAQAGRAQPPSLAELPSGFRLASVDEVTQFSLEQLMDLEVVSASRFSQHISDAPAAVTVLRGADIRHYGWRTLADLLRSVRGFYVSYDRMYSFIGARGFSPPGDYNTRLLVLVDGYRINDNIYDSGAIGEEFPLDLTLIDRVEIVRGPASSLYGSNALFGVVNVITRSGAQLGGGETELDLAHLGGRAARVSHGGHTGAGLDWLVSLSARKSDGADLALPEFPGRVAHGNDHEEGHRLFAKLGWRGWSLTLIDARRDKGLATGIYGTEPDLPGSRAVDAYTGIDLAHYHLFENGTEATTRLYHGDYRYIGDYVYMGNAAPYLNRDDGRGAWWGAELKLLSSLGRHKLAYGIEYQRNTRQAQTNVGDDTNPAIVLLDSHPRGERWAAYVQDEFAPSPLWRLSTGLRYDHASIGGGELNPRLGLIRHAEGGHTWKLLYGSAYRSPNAYEREYAYPNQNQGNPNLKPERIRSLEAVWEHQTDADLRLSASAYRYRIEDWIVQQVNPASGLLQYQNQPAVDAHGIEFELERQWPASTRLRASYALQFAPGRTSQTINQAPRHLVKANLDTPLGPRWHLGAEAQYTSARSTTSGAVDGYALANLALRYQRGDKAPALTLGIHNLFDTAYADPAVDIAVPARESLAQDGRAWRIKLELPF